MVDRYGWHRESDPNKIYYDYNWCGDSLSLNTKKEIEFLTREEAVSLAKWILESVPKTGYKITTIFDEKPDAVYIFEGDIGQNTRFLHFDVEEVQY
jgi:hypothetical protein